MTSAGNNFVFLYRGDIPIDTTSNPFLDYYRCPEIFAASAPLFEASRQSRSPFSGDALPPDGLSLVGRSPVAVYGQLRDALADVAVDGGSSGLPLGPNEIIEILRLERYARNSHNGLRRSPLEHPFWPAYRLLRPALPTRIRKHLQGWYLRRRHSPSFPSWPVDTTVDDILEELFSRALRAHAVDRIPFIWFWPDGTRSCAIITHDVETLAGRNFCSRLMDLDDSVAIKSSFQIVPEQRYDVPTSFLEDIRSRGFEINVHDINHDGQLFTSWETFLPLAERINAYAREFGAIGFRSGSLYRNPEWFTVLDFAYDMSIPNSARLEPQSGGCCTVLPFFIGEILELPVTTTQDYSLFHILNTYTLDLWKRQIARITDRHGLLSFIVHPDYVIEKRAKATYQALLAYIAQLRSDGVLWTPLPREVNQWWRDRNRMKVVSDGGGWRIEGAGRERARLAYASLVGDQLTFTLDDKLSPVRGL